MTNAPPSRNPSDNDSLQGLFRIMLEKFLANVDDMLPAQVIGYDAATNTASLQPLIVCITTAGEQVKRAQIASVPVFQLGAGNFILNFPIKTGDLGWIKANDRDISLFKKNFNESPPNTYRKHSFEDAVFFPHVMRDYAINAEDANNVVLQTLDGSVRVALWDDKVKITAPQVIIDTPLLTITGIIDVLNENSETTPCTINGNINTNGDVIATGVSLVTHIHDGVTPGSGNTGAPV